MHSAQATKLTIAGTGLDGLVGSRIVELLSGSHKFLPIPQSKMDITDRSQVLSIINSLSFDIFLHLAAYTNVDGAQDNREMARKVNVDGTRHVFDAVRKRGKKFIYISTDFVFDGENPPFIESSPPNPLNYYGQTKLAGEKIVAGEGMIVRISYPYRANFAPKTDFVRSIIALLKSGQSVRGITDHIITLTFIDDIAYALDHLVQNFKRDIYHVVGADSLSTYDAIMTICEEFNLDKSLISKTTSDEFYKGKAKRPKKGIIKSEKNTFYKMKSFREGLREMRKQGNYTSPT